MEPEEMIDAEMGFEAEDVVEDIVEDDTPQIMPEEFVAAVTGSENLAAELDEDQLNDIARQVVDDFNMDEESMADWTTKMRAAIDLANLIKTDKTYPFKNAANIKYPLITSAALQFNARAYPAIVTPQALVKSKVHGSDKSGEKAARGERVAAHMSYQLLNRVTEWEEGTDSLLVQLPIVGTMVRKWWYDPVAEKPKCRLLKPGAFVVNNNVTSLDDAPRCSEKLPLYPTDIESRIRSGQFIDFDYQPDEDDQGAQDFIEQHCRIDLDEDGYPEPYVVTVHSDTQKVVRVVADFSPEDVRYEYEEQMQPAMVDAPMPVLDANGQPSVVMMQQETMQPVQVATRIIGINRGSYFVAYRFMPSIDGGFWGTGLGLLLGDISNTINTILNMMLDAGHRASMGGGFLGSGFRVKGASQRFEPGEWKTASERGATIRENIVPLTFPGPDAVLFQVLGLLIDAGKEISSTKDIMTGDTGGVNQTATTTLALIEQGMMVFSAAYKRIFRSLKAEYRMIAAINASTVTAEDYNQFHDETDQQGQPVMLDPAQDYGAQDMDIQPVADPNSVTKMQEMAKAQLLSDMATQGLVDPAAAGARILEAAQIEQTEDLVPEPDPMQAQMAQQAAQMQMQMAQLEMSLKRADIAQKMAAIDKTLAEIEKMKADAVKTMAEAEATGERLRLDAIEMVLKDSRDELERGLKIGLAGLATESRDRSDARRAAGSAGQPAPAGGGQLSIGQAMAGSQPGGPASFG